MSILKIKDAQGNVQEVISLRGSKEKFQKLFTFPDKSKKI